VAQVGFITLGHHPHPCYVYPGPTPFGEFGSKTPPTATLAIARVKTPSSNSLSSSPFS